MRMVGSASMHPMARPLIRYHMLKKGREKEEGKSRKRSEKMRKLTADLETEEGTKQIRRRYQKRCPDRGGSRIS